MESRRRFVLKDSGKREAFDTGSRRDTRDGKGRYDLLSPFVMARDARLLELGARKYGERNWEKGQPFSRFLDSGFRHLMRWLEGHRDEDHLAAARWNIGAIMHLEEMIRRGTVPSDLMDIPSWSAASAGNAGLSKTIRQRKRSMKPMKYGKAEANDKKPPAPKKSTKKSSKKK